MLKLQVLSAQDNVIHLSCEGDLTLATVPPNENPLAHALGPGCFTTKVLLNMDKTGYLDSVGVNFLIRNHKQFHDEGGRFVLHSLPPEAKNLLRLLRLDKVLHLAADENAARELVRSGEVAHG